MPCRGLWQIKSVLSLNSWDTNFLYYSWRPTFSRSCCDACSSVCPDLTQLWPWAAYSPRPCSCSHAHTSSLLQREKGTSPALGRDGEREEHLNQQVKSFGLADRVWIDWIDQRFCILGDTYLCLASRDQPSRGPAVALTPPLLNSMSDASSRLKEVEWLLFSLWE